MFAKIKATLIFLIICLLQCSVKTETGRATRSIGLLHSPKLRKANNVAL